MIPLPPPIVSRFAPSPTGYLHLGHLVNALYVWGITRALHGNVILRMEDHDRGRCRPEYEAAILEDLEWLGLDPDLGRPEDFRGGGTPYRQSDNDEGYRDILRDLEARHLLYTCTCSRKEVLARSEEAVQGELRYDGFCRLKGYEPDHEGGTRIILHPETINFYDQRMGLQSQEPFHHCGDVLLKDRHGNWTYQFAVTVDDWQQGVDLVIRGEDLLDSTARQLQMAYVLGQRRMPRYLHHPLIHSEDGKKLSKRDFSKGLRDYRAEGRSPESVMGEAAWRVGLIEKNDALCLGDVIEIFTAHTLVKELEAQRLPLPAGMEECPNHE